MATAMAIRVITTVPMRRGNTPYSGLAKSGVHVVVKRNSVSGISAKNSTDGMSTEMTIPKVVKRETAAAATRIPRMIASP